MFLQGIEQRGGKAEVALHELSGILRAVHTCKIEHEITFLAPCIKLLRRGIKVELEDFIYLQVSVATGLAILDIIELGAKILAYKAFGACYQYLHAFLLDKVTLSAQFLLDIFQSANLGLGLFQIQTVGIV